MWVQMWRLCSEFSPFCSTWCHWLHLCNVRIPINLMVLLPFIHLLWTCHVLRAEGGFRALNQFWIFFFCTAQQAPSLFRIILTAIVKWHGLLLTQRAQKAPIFFFFYQSPWLRGSSFDDLFSLCGNFWLLNLENGDTKDGAAAGVGTTFDQKWKHL